VGELGKADAGEDDAAERQFVSRGGQRDEAREQRGGGKTTGRARWSCGSWNEAGGVRRA
jgi:hypothetical protein